MSEAFTLPPNPRDAEMLEAALEKARALDDALSRLRNPPDDGLITFSLNEIGLLLDAARQDERRVVRQEGLERMRSGLGAVMRSPVS